MKKEEMYFLIDLITLLKEDALEAKKNKVKNKNSKNAEFYDGVLTGYYEVFDTIKNQLFTFQIDPKKVKFDIDPDKDLL